MKQEVKEKKRLSEKARAIIFLAVLLVLTVFVSTISFVGMPLDARGLYKLKPWVPSGTWPTALPLGKDLASGVRAEFQGTQIKGTGTKMAESLSTTVSILQKRLSDSQLAGTATVVGNDGVWVELPAGVDTDVVMPFLTDPAKLEILNPDGTVLLDNEDIESAAIGSTTDSGYKVTIVFVTAAKKQYSDMAATDAGKALAVRYNGVVMEGVTLVPTDTIGTAELTSIPSQSEATQFALKVNSGTLPLTLTQQRLDIFSSAYAPQALLAGVAAVGLGLVLVVLLLILRYRLCGLTTVWSLLLYVVLMFFFFVVVDGVQLTLPAIAGIVAALGMAVGFAVLLLERLRQEIGLGRPVEIALKQSLKTSWPVLLEAGMILTLLSLVLWLFGSDALKPLGTVLFFHMLIGLVVMVLVNWFMMSQTAILVGKKAELLIWRKAPAKEAQ